MKFLFADSMDYVDPRYNFITDQFGENREPYWDDSFPHEIMTHTPYDGVLISRAMVGEPAHPGKYGESLSMRFRRIGAREHLRLTEPRHVNLPIFGDNGAFSYAHMLNPPYTPNDTVEFYADGQFTHGCSVDHIIFEFDTLAKGMNGGSDDSRRRFALTLDLATDFLSESKAIGNPFIPIGVIQGWSPDSLAVSAKSLVSMGYKYLAIGGLVPLSSLETHMAISAVEDAIKGTPDVKLHLLGFAKADTLHEFAQYRHIASFDTTSPLLRSFKDATKNYYMPNNEGLLDYYTAIRIPQAITNNKLKSHAKSGRYKQEHLLDMEKKALHAIRHYAAYKVSIENCLDAVMTYAEPLETSDKSTEESVLKKITTLRTKYRKTLQDRPWENCQCDICTAVGVETLIFRGSNRNKRRGIHNLGVYHKHLQRINNQ
jgi:queuine/archaeosine tRNA-ribosyltransferase